MFGKQICQHIYDGKIFITLVLAAVHDGEQVPAWLSTAVPLRVTNSTLRAEDFYAFLVT